METANGGRDGGLGGTGGGATSGGAMARALSFTVDGASIGAVDAFVAISLRPPATGPGTTAWRGTIRATGRASAVMGTGTGVPAVVLIFGERAGTFGAAGDKARDADVVDASTRGATGAARLGSAALATVDVDELGVEACRGALGSIPPGCRRSNGFDASPSTCGSRGTVCDGPATLASAA